MKSIDGSKKPKKGRPPVDTAAVNLRLPQDTISAIDDYRRHLDGLPTRPEAIRRLIELGLGTLPKKVFVKILKK